MRVLCCHPSGLMYTEIYLRLEPLGLELVAAAARAAGHEVRLLDLQVARHGDYWRLLDEWRPDAVAFGLNYLPNGRREFVHSETGVRTLKDEFDKVAWHNEHHLEQIEQALQARSGGSQ